MSNIRGGLVPPLKKDTEMAKNCDTSVIHDFSYDCENPPVAGLEDEALLINRADIDFAKCTYDETNKNIIKSIVLKAGKKANVVQQRKESFNGTKVEQVEGTYSVGTTQTFAFVAFANSADEKTALENILNGSFVAVVKNKSAADNSRYEVLGWNTGLKTPTLSKDYVAEESAGVYAVTLASGQEPRLPMSFFATDLETTEEAFESLKSATV